VSPEPGAPVSDLTRLLRLLEPELHPGVYGFTVLAGAHHDHLFVPAARAEEALDALRRLRQ
jgi:hypothetical protein